METNTILTGLIAFVLFLMSLFVIAWVIIEKGVSQSERDYERDYNMLVMLVRYSLINESSKEYILKEFETLHRYKCRNKEKLSVLKYEFKNRFAEILK